MSESESIVCPNCSERSPGGYILCPYCGFDLTRILRARERIRVPFRETFMRIYRSLFDPRESKTLFEEIGVNPDRKGALFVLYLLSVAYAMRLGALVLKASTPSWHDFHFWFFIISPWIVGFALFILAIFGWLTSGLLTWLIAKTLGGKAGYRDTLGVIGYALGPLITASVVISLIIVIIGAPLSSIDANSSTAFTIFDMIYLPFLALVAHHAANGIRTAHLLSNLYSYLISGGITAAFTVFFLIPVIFGL